MKDIPEYVRKVCRCSVLKCKRPLVRSPHGWVCPIFGHGGIVTDAELRARITHAKQGKVLKGVPTTDEIMQSLPLEEACAEATK